MNEAYEQLIEAVSDNDKAKVFELVNQGLDATKCSTFYGKSALSISASKGFTDVSKLLTSKFDSEEDSNADRKDANGRAPNDYALAYGHNHDQRIGTRYYTRIKLIYVKFQSIYVY